MLVLGSAWFSFLMLCVFSDWSSQSHFGIAEAPSLLCLRLQQTKAPAALSPKQLSQNSRSIWRTANTNNIDSFYMYLLLVGSIRYLCIGHWFCDTRVSNASIKKPPLMSPLTTTRRVDGCLGQSSCQESAKSSELCWELCRVRLCLSTVRARLGQIQIQDVAALHIES